VKESRRDEKTYSTTTGDHSNDETLVALLLGGGEALRGSAFEH